MVARGGIEPPTRGFLVAGTVALAACKSKTGHSLSKGVFRKHRLPLAVPGFLKLTEPFLDLSMVGASTVQWHPSGSHSWSIDHNPSGWSISSLP